MLAGFLTKKLTLNKSEVKCLIQGLTSLLLSPGGAEGGSYKVSIRLPKAQWHPRLCDLNLCVFRIHYIKAKLWLLRDSFINHNLNQMLNVIK